MDPSHNFPPSPRDMYMYRPAQQVNGHTVQSPSPTRGRPPPVLPERKPETQLSNRSSRSSVPSRGSTSSDIASPPQSPGYVGHSQQSFHHQGHTHHPNSKPFSYATGINPPQTTNVHSLTEANIRVKMEREASPHSGRGNTRSEGGADFQRFLHNDGSLSHPQNNAAIYQRIDRNRVASTPDTLMTGGQGYHENDPLFYAGINTRQSEGIYGQFIEPSNGGPHRPSLTYVPPPVVPTMQTDHDKVDKVVTREQPHHIQQQQQHHQPLQQHKVKAPSVHVPPPPPPLRTSSTSQLPMNHQPDLNPAPAGVRSPRSGSPARPPGAVSHHSSHKQPTLATMDELAQVKLRAVSDSTPHSPLLSPVTATDFSSGAINVKLRPTPGKFSKIYAEDETTLPPPPPLDDLDELPPPPPPPELLTDDLVNLSLDSTTHVQRHSVPSASHLQQPHVLPGEADSTHIDHRLQQQPLRQRQPVTSATKPQHPDISSAAGDKLIVCGNSKAQDNFSSALEQLRSESVSSMDFEIPDDIDLSQCPGLVEINMSTPNWKKDMIEKKNQEKIEEYVKKVLKEREQEAKWKNIPDWKKKILQKKEDEETGSASPAPETKTPAPGKKPAKKAPVPPPKETKDDFTPPKPKGDIVPAALSIDPEELAAMPPWKRELLFKRDKVPVTFANEFNPDDEENAENENVPSS